MLIFPLDVRDAAKAEAWVNETMSQFGRLDGAANVAGVVPRSIGGDAGLIESCDMNEYNFITDVSTKGLMLCMKYQLAVMKKESG